MNGLTTDFLAHLIATGTIEEEAATWALDMESGGADEVGETMDFMARLAQEWLEYVKGVNLVEVADAYRRHLKTHELLAQYKP